MTHLNRETEMNTTTTWNEGAPIPDEMSASPVSKAISDAWDGHDPWGSAMAEGFALCDFVTFYLDAPEEVPSELGYRPAGAGFPVNSSEDDYIYQDLVRGFEHGDFTAADAYDYLPTLNRYLDVCKAAGRDY